MILTNSLINSRGSFSVDPSGFLYAQPCRLFIGTVLFLSDSLSFHDFFISLTVLNKNGDKETCVVHNLKRYIFSLSTLIKVLAVVLFSMLLMKLTSSLMYESRLSRRNR